ncbi:MAG: glucosamine-6-phosphate deaminase, partial [Clostridiales bacterium]|nr:glucosamine-6-phosphate deaminase [Clostridiales bacterium]
MHSNINLLIEPDYAAMSRKAAEVFAEALRERPEGVFGFATGGTPEGMYENLIRMHRENGLDFSKMNAFNLDEYYPIKQNDSQSYYYFMREKLFSHVNVSPGHTHIPNGEASDPAAECAAYDREIETYGGVDLQILGIGANGHIGFNEPSESFTSRTNYVALTEITVQSNSRFFESLEQVPRHALTMGIRPIMMSGQIMLLCSGASKAEIL